MASSIATFGSNDMRLTRIHFGVLEECLGREKARSLYDVLYLQNETIFWYRRGEDCPNRAWFSQMAILDICEPYMKAAVVLEVERRSSHKLSALAFGIGRHGAIIVVIFVERRRL